MSATQNLTSSQMRRVDTLIRAALSRRGVPLPPASEYRWTMDMPPYHSAGLTQWFKGLTEQQQREAVSGVRRGWERYIAELQRSETVSGMASEELGSGRVQVSGASSDELAAQWELTQRGGRRGRNTVWVIAGVLALGALVWGAIE